MLHADAIITGSVALMGGKIQLHTRIIDFESAYVIGAESKTTSEYQYDCEQSRQKAFVHFIRNLAFSIRK